MKPGLRIEFDPQKDRVNREKHSVSLALARDLEWDEALIHEDTRMAYGEIRMIAVAPIRSRLYVVVYTDRLECRRIISLRKANDREVKAYVAHV